MDTPTPVQVGPPKTRTKSYVARCKETLRLEIEEAIRVHGVERLAVMTVTLPAADRLKWWNEADWSEVMTRWNSFTTNFLNRRVPQWARICEPHNDGTVHLHVIIVCPVDVRSGVDFKAIAAGDYRSAGSWLRRWWALLRGRADAYGFGRCHTLPVQHPKAVGFYVAKYLGKHAGEAQGFRARRVSYSRAWARSTSMRAGWVYRRELAASEDGGLVEVPAFRFKCQEMARQFGGGFQRWVNRAGGRWAHTFMSAWQAVECQNTRDVPLEILASDVGVVLGVEVLTHEAAQVQAAFRGRQYQPVLSSTGHVVGCAMSLNSSRSEITVALASARERLRCYLRAGDTARPGDEAGSVPARANLQTSLPGLGL